MEQNKTRLQQFLPTVFAGISRPGDDFHLGQVSANFQISGTPMRGEKKHQNDKHSPQQMFFLRRLFHHWLEKKPNLKAQSKWNVIHFSLSLSEFSVSMNGQHLWFCFWSWWSGIFITYFEIMPSLLSFSHLCSFFFVFILTLVFVLSFIKFETKLQL